jgi:4-amino-4-deoxy-L-arabinose transferase-like glycosyltransferase
MSPPSQASRRLEWLILAAILLVAAFLRLYQLDVIPPGFTHDEAAHGNDALAILHGARPIYETVGYGREPLYDYAVAMTMDLLARTDYVAVRLTSVFWGLLTVAATYLCVRRMFDAPTALLTTAMLAVSFWAISTSRQALRSVMLPALLAFAVYFWWQGYTSLHTLHSTLHFVISGVFLAAALWTYMAARATWILFVIGPALAFALDRERFKARWPGMVLMLGVGALLAAPMFVWLQTHPGAEQRLSQLGEPLRLLASGNPGEILKNAVEALGMFTFRADTLWLYNIPGQPWLDPVTGALFYAGIGVAIWNWRKPAHLLSLAWLAVGVFPSLMTGIAASGTRAVAVQPVLYLFPAMTLVTLTRWLRAFLYHKDTQAQRSKWLSWRLSASVITAFVAMIGALSFRDYFITWANARDVRVAYHTTLFEIARYLDHQPTRGTVAISSIYPGRFHDPYSMAMTLHRRDVSLRWFDGRDALALPPAGSKLIVQAISPVDPALAGLISSGAHQTDSRLLRPNDLNPRFDVFDWNGAQNDSFRKPDGPADFGHTLDLIGYSINTGQREVGGELLVVTLWRVRSATDPNKETVLFTHLLKTTEGPVLAQQDLIGYPSWQWQPNDEFAQVHRFIIPPGTPPGSYPLEVGAYTRDIPSAVQPNPPTARLAVYDGDKITSDRVLLPSVTVVGDK